MSEKLILPQGETLQAPGFDAAYIVQALAGSLAAVQRQLDLLIRLECGALKRADMKLQYKAFDEAVAQSEQATEDDLAKARAERAEKLRG